MKLDLNELSRSCSKHLGYADTEWLTTYVQCITTNEYNRTYKWLNKELLVNSIRALLAICDNEKVDLNKYITIESLDNSN